MGKTLKEAQLTTRNARSKLPPGLHWKSIDPQTHLGYRKAKRGGIWLVRWRHGIGYRQRPLGAADDTLTENTLSYEKVLPIAKRTVEAARVESKATAAGPPLTVRSALLDYIAERDARDSRRRGRPVRSDASRRLGRYVLGADARGVREAIPGAPLADVALYALSETDLREWRKALPGKLKATSQHRLVSDLKAALNAAYMANRQRLDPGLPAIVKHGLRPTGIGAEDSEPVARDNQILTDAQVARLIAAAREIDAEQERDGDLYRLAIVLAATGARFSQVAPLLVGDVQYQQGRLMVPASRKGRGKSGSIAVPVGRDILDALRPATTGRPANAPLLERWRHEQVAGAVRLSLAASRARPMANAIRVAAPMG